MGYDKQTLINYRISRSEETLDDARLALDNSRLASAANRIYYAGYYIISALALKNDFSTSKHSQLISWFNKNFVKPGTVPKEIGKIIFDAFETRQEGDYDDLVYFEKSNLEAKYDLMINFIGTIKQLF